MFSSSLSLAKTHFTMKYNSRNQSLQSADVFLALIYPVGIYLLKVNNENTTAICNVSSQSTLSSFHTLLRSSRPEVYCKKSVLRNFEKSIGKHLCQCLFFNKVACLRPATLLKKKLWHRCFPVNFAKFLRTPFLQSISRALLLYVISFSFENFYIN